MPKTYQQTINLIIATNPLLLTNYLHLNINLAYQPDARTLEDVSLDTIYHLPIVIPPPDPKYERCREPIYNDIMDYLLNEKPVTTSYYLAQAFERDQNKMSECLYNLESIGKLRKYKFKSQHAAVFYTLIDYQLKLSDIPDAALFDEIVRLRNAGYQYNTIAEKLHLTHDYARAIVRRWPEQRAQLLTTLIK